MGTNRHIKPKSDGFFAAVYAIVARIPAGKVATYGQIAMLAGRPGAARVVGYAMSSPTHQPDIPCHRVVNRLGEMAPEHAFGGQEFQRFLLESEGVAFLEDGHIDMVSCVWKPESD